MLVWKEAVAYLRDRLLNYFPAAKHMRLERMIPQVCFAAGMIYIQ